ncbi:hypothetical protein [Leifsonia aquatica]|uniref:hypothetical protein n=1 Tax=Leifsonia aquatica TaxID=144185 RepID=UPI0028AA3C30|nr:hypothetical protein [Leifsonia aquatica]
MLMAASQIPAVAHDAFDWWANIWIPSFVGTATFAVALVSAVIALRTHRFERKDREEAMERQRRTDRRRLAAAIRRYVEAAALQYGRKGDIALDAIGREEFVEATHMATDQLDEKNALRVVIWASHKLQARDRTGDERDFVFASFTAQHVNAVVRRWVRDPETDLDEFVDPTERIIVLIRDAQLKSWNESTGKFDDPDVARAVLAELRRSSAEGAES